MGDNEILSVIVPNERNQYVFLKDRDKLRDLLGLQLMLLDECIEYGIIECHTKDFTIIYSDQIGAQLQFQCSPHCDFMQSLAEMCAFKAPGSRIVMKSKELAAYSPISHLAGSLFYLRPGINEGITNCLKSYF